MYPCAVDDNKLDYERGLNTLGQDIISMRLSQISRLGLPWKGSGSRVNCFLAHIDRQLVVLAENLIRPLEVLSEGANCSVLLMTK